MKVADETKKALQKGNNEKVTIPKTFVGMKSEGIRELLDLYRAQIAQAIPNNISAERVIQICTTVITRNPDIVQCSSSSIIGAVMQSGILGLDPTPQLGHCYFVPYKNSKTGVREVQFQLGYRGLINLVRRSQQVKTIYAYCVYENDTFRYNLGLEPNIEHVPNPAERGNLKYVYAVIKYKDDGFQFEVMSKKEVYHIRAKSQAKNSAYSPWNTDESEMWRKTVLKRLLKFTPLEVEKQKQLAADNVIIEPDKFDTNRKEVDINLIEYEEVKEPKNVDKETGEIKESENNDDAFSKMTNKDFEKECQSKKEELKSIFSDDKEYYRVLSKFNYKHSNQAVRSQYKNILMSLYDVINQAKEEMKK